MSTHNSLIKVTYYFNDQEASLTFDPINKLSVLRNIICLSLKLNFNEYEFVYNKKKLLNTDDRIMKDIIGNDKNPHFYIKKISIEYIYEKI